MWQVLLAAAAAAGSGILAKKLMNPFETEKPFSHFNQNDRESEQNNESFQPQDLVLSSNNTFQEKRDATGEDGEIFRFSSAQRRHDLKKKTGCKLIGIKKNGGAKKGKKSRVVEGGENELERGNGTAKRISVCLKKRKTGKNVAGKCESCASKDSSFSWGVGVGIMYMMSAGKAEISRLNSTMGETSKIVEELKAEISRRKSSCNVHASVAANEAEANKKHVEGNYSGRLVTKPGECGSSLCMG
ncbi:hypothetical protein CDL12_16882 [Handroanthus impetiginosus]|uniref:Uncharacterized protein n=1 Tax=Handroanthus impetiginosus TaxID=429701 RepID=A0A2G9GZ17_9LAMI|nr:hypothetical protein CDL12_16882 [Handroanthus impetiginosus]